MVSSQSAEQAPLSGSGLRVALVLGFGGMLLLIALIGAHSIRVLEAINAESAASGQIFVEKSRTLENIRSALYLYGADGRFDPNSVRQLRELIGQNVMRYATVLSVEERPALVELQRGIAAYLDSLDRANSPRELAVQRLRIAEITDKIGDMSESRLRTASQRSSALMSETRNRVILILGGTASFGLLLAFSVVAYIFRLERSLRDRYQQISVVQGELHQLSEKLVKAQEEERRSIARELHDEIGQSMSALLVDLSNGRLDSAKQLAESSVAAVRNLALLLRPSMLDDLGLAPALNWQAREVSRRTGMRVDVLAENLPEDLPDEHRTCVYRIVQEALNNVARHAGATAVIVKLELQPGEISMTIEDNGCGFDPAITRGMGLLGMGERVRNMHGAYSIDSKPGQGTTLRVRLPLDTASLLQ